MFKTHRVVKRTAAALLTVSGLIIIAWGHGRPAPVPARGATDSVRAVKLRLTFEGSHWANVTEVEGGTIKVERDGKKLALTPYIRDQKSSKVELRVFQVIQRGSGETLEAIDTLMVGTGPTKLDRGGLSFGVQVLDVEKRLPRELLAAPAAECCTRTCNGTLVCGVCVCTDCGVCFTHGWCDCNPPAPPEE
ncbi:MAG: hypothetical protein ACJ754_14730 [Pyrinomonadaceae bacterium]